MDKKIANSMIVGVFVILGFLALVFVLFTMGSGSVFTPTFRLKAKFSQVNGLHMGSEVLLAGLRIGVVKDITISAGENKELVADLSLEREYQDRLRADSVASIKTAGVLGDRYIEISIGSPSAPVLQHGEFIKTEEPPDLLSQSGHLVEGISKEFDKNGEFTQFLTHLNTLSENLITITADIRKDKGLLHELVYGSSGAKVNQSVDHLEQILRKINNGEGSLGALINDPTVYEDVKAMLGGAKRSTILQYFMKQFIQSGRTEENSTPANPH
jgi:phospholipid/cholesterol/gamma-HCH transport system substrate-binding protein